jgi:hypothetical protein
MRNGFLGSIMLLVLVVARAPAQTPPAAPTTLSLSGSGAADIRNPVFDPGWQPLPPTAATGGDDRPNLSPPGYRFYGNVDYIMWWTQQNDFGPLFRNGLRGELGMWLNSQQSVGLEIGGFWVDDKSPTNGFHAGELSGGSQLHNALCGAEAQLRAEVYRGDWVHFDVLAGFRFLSLDEALGIEERDASADVVASDGYGTHNRFYGGLLGGEMYLHYEK